MLGVAGPHVVQMGYRSHGIGTGPLRLPRILTGVRLNRRRVLLRRASWGNWLEIDTAGSVSLVRGECATSDSRTESGFVTFEGPWAFRTMLEGLLVPYVFHTRRFGGVWPRGSLSSHDGVPARERLEVPRSPWW
jgi:hypothetical protein